MHLHFTRELENSYKGLQQEAMAYENILVSTHMCINIYNHIADTPRHNDSALSLRICPAHIVLYA